MRFDPPLEMATLQRRYKRFLADVRGSDGTEFTVHCPNTGAMLGCADPGAAVWLSRSDSPNRKYPHTWELVEAAGGTLVGINTGRANALVREALQSPPPALASLRGLRFDRIRTEVRYGEERSRIDLLLESEGEPPRYVEVKNVTAAVSDGVALFPDAVTTRGAKHLRELATLARSGQAAALLVFCIQRHDVHEVRPADDIDPAYGEALRAALADGVQTLALRASVSEQGIALTEEVPVVT